MRVGAVPLPTARPLGLGRVGPGLLLTGAVALTAHLAATALFPYALAAGFEVPLAMLLGLVVAQIGAATARTLPGIRFCVKHVLALGIVLLGLRLNLQSVAAIGLQALGLVLVTIGVTCGFAVLVGRRLGVDRGVALLIGVGTSVCGNSAIVAAAPLVRAGDREVSFAVATITLFGSLAVFIFPLIGHALDLDVLTYGFWAGSSVPDTAQTIATGAAYSSVGRDVATVIKLVRNVLIVPLLLLIAWGWSRHGDASAASAAQARRGARKAFPYFLIGFLALAMVRTLRLVDPATVTQVDVVTRVCFVMALAALGLQTRLQHIRALGPRPFLLGLATAGTLATGSLAAIVGLGLGPPRTAVAGAVDPRPPGAWSTVCRDGHADAFSGAFARLARRYPQALGRPAGCARFDVRSGETVQRTTRGVAVLRPATGVATFSDGARRWSIGPVHRPSTSRAHATVRLTGRVLAVGIPGAGALSPVGTFHPGGPIHDKRQFAASTRAGGVLDPARLLVASDSNFGAPLARPGWAAGSILSLATRSRRRLVVPADLASSGAQSRAGGGAVALYAAQAPSFLNHSDAATAGMPAVSGPRGISVNNAFGRPWIANSPAPGIGAESVLDPDGRPLDDAPSRRAGGVFAGRLTNRASQRAAGSVEAGAVGNALLGASPDTSGRAVFAVATADGALVQIHVEEGVDGLAPPGTFAPTDPPARVGVVFNWVPDRFLYVSDPGNDAVLRCAWMTTRRSSA